MYTFSPEPILDVLLLFGYEREASETRQVVGSDVNMILPRLKRLGIGLLPVFAFLLFREPIPPNLAADERVLLLTAHPDDECFFFGPTLLALSPQTDNLFSLTVSNGNNDGIGSRREPELRSSLAILGIPPERSFLLNHPLLQDNFTQAWDADIIVESVLPYVIQHNITLLLTFDDKGVSSHPNHYSLYYGSQRLLDSLPKDAVHLRAYALKTYPIYIKYSGWITIFSKFYLYAYQTGDAISSGIPTLRFTSGIASYLTIFRAMNQHHSQMVWFRWLYLLFSSYMWRNDWIEIERHVE